MFWAVGFFTNSEGSSVVSFFVKNEKGWTKEYWCGSSHSGTEQKGGSITRRDDWLYPTKNCFLLRDRRKG